MMNIERSPRAATFGAVLLALAGPACAQTTMSIAAPFDAAHWVLAPGAKIVPFAGRQALMGTAYVKDSNLVNGTIETDIWMSGAVNYAGLMFHVQSFEELEWIWFRTHKTGGTAGDGIQYAPAYHGVFCWQLYPQYNAAVTVPKNQWVHLKLTILNDKAALYVTDMEKPVMTVDHLQLGDKRGLVGLKALLNDTVYFSNFSYQADEASPVAAAPQPAAPNVVTTWRLSPSYLLPAVDGVTTAYPARELAEATWITPDVAPSGLVNITRYHGTKEHGRAQAEGGKPAWTMLRTYIDAEKPARVKMNFGYSDVATIFLNKQPLFWGNSAFVSRNSSFGGWISFNDAVFLNLKKGRNELVVAVAEDFGGWGFQARLDSVEGLKLHAGID